MKKIFFISILISLGMHSFAQHTFQNHGLNVGINTLRPSEALEIAEGNEQITRGSLYLGKKSYFNTNDFYSLYATNTIFIKNRLPGPGLYLRLDEDVEYPPFANFAIAGNDGNYNYFSKKGDLVIREGGRDYNKLLLTNSGGGDIVFATGAWQEYNRIRMVINGEGNVGIGTLDPGSWKLAVNGNIRAKEIKVETGWSDFVFDPDYDLPSLKEVENYIKQHGHLKDIPSQKEVEKNGVNLGEINSKLLQKIEELTLYIIQLNNKINELEKNQRNK